MTTYFTTATNTSPTDTVTGLLHRMLTQHMIDAVLVQAPTPYSKLPLPMLVTDPEQLAGAEPLAPVAPFNAARQAAAVTRHAVNQRIALVMRPCEIRAWIELTKLNQCVRDHVVIIGFDCLGRMANDTYLNEINQNPDLTRMFYTGSALHANCTAACQRCTRFLPSQADLAFCFLGTAPDQPVIAAATATGRTLLKDLDLAETGAPPQREAAVTDMQQERRTTRDARAKEINAAISTMAGFQELIATCLNCYNCRTACPVCYCKECVFLTDVFAHAPETLLQRATKKGRLKLPTDTTMFHLTRLAHMAHACVGCGQCSSVCPSHIPVAALFQTVARRVQDTLDYQPGRDANEPIPFLVYGKKEDQ